MTHLTYAFKSPEIYVLIHLSYLNLIFYSAVPTRYLSQSTRYLSKYMGAAAVLQNTWEIQGSAFSHCIKARKGTQ